jgi:hypothetical protein
MSETPEAPAPSPDPTPEAPAAAAPTEPAATPAKRSLEDLLGTLDEDARMVVLGEVSKARNEAKNLRERFKEAEPKLTEYERLVEASKSDLERAQEAAKSANDRATGMLRDVATAKLEAALTGVVPDVAGFLEDLNVDKFIADGVINTEAIAALRTKYAAFAPVQPGMKPNPSQGRSASPSPGINEQIAQAQAAGDTKAAIRLKAAQQLSVSDL